MKSEKIEGVLKLHVPPGSLEYCMSLWRLHDFEFRLRKNRVTKIGDFTFRANRSPRITVNQDLHPYMFLTTYLHEVAHVIVHHRHGNRIAGHGIEWKTVFRETMEPVLLEDNFPVDLLTALRKHLADPKATTFSDPELSAVFRKYDVHAQAMTMLSEIPAGSIFGLRGRWFRKGETKRTRVVCHEVKTRRKYLVPADAPVENVQLKLL